MPRKKQVRQQNIKYDNQNTKYANQNTKYANQKFTLFCREAIFVANLRTFLAYFFQAKKYGGVPKRTNIRYGSGPPDGHPAAFVGGGAPPCVCFWDCNCQRLNKSLLQLRLACTGSGSSIAGSAQGSCQQKTSCLCSPFWRQLLPPCLDCLEGI